MVVRKARPLHAACMLGSCCWASFLSSPAPHYVLLPTRTVYAMRCVCFICRLYVPDCNGNLWCLDAVTGAVIWQRTIADLVYSVDPKPYPFTSNKTIISRASPAVVGNLLVSGASCVCTGMHANEDTGRAIQHVPRNSGLTDRHFKLEVEDS